MTRKAKIVLVAGGALALGLGGVAAAGAAGGENERPITGPALEQASAAARAQTGGGTVTDTEVGDEEGYYEVEVTLDDGSKTDVHLGSDFGVLGETADRE